VGHGGYVAQELLDGVRNDRGVVDKELPLVRILAEKLDR